MRDLLLVEIRDAYRVLAKNKLLTLIAILLVTLGLTAVTTMFSVINNLMLVPSGYVDPERIVGIFENQPQINIENYSTWLAEASSFEGITGYKIEAFFILGGLEPERIRGVRVSRSLFSVVGVRPVLGRGFAQEEDTSGKGLSVVLSYSYWQKAFDGSPDVLGKIIKVNRSPHTIVGVMPRGFTFPLKWEPNVWVPFGSPEENKLPGKGKRIFLMGRLKKGVSFQQVQAELDVLSANKKIKNYKLTIDPQQEMSWGDLSIGTKLLAGAALFVMLICCANISNLLLSKGADRAKEVAIRRALGASRVTLLRQFLFESIILFLLGSACALLLTKWVLEFVPIKLPIILTFHVDSEIDWRTLCFSAGAAFLSAVTAGIMPAVRSSRVDFSEALKEGGHRTQTDQSGRRIQKMLTIFQIAASVCLLIGSGLLIKTMMKINSIEAGFDPSNVKTIYVALSSYKYKENYQWIQFFNELSGNIKQIPGIESSGLIRSGGIQEIVKIDGERFDKPQEFSTHSISSGYFKTLRIPVKQGRDFSESDLFSPQPIAIINEEFARKFYGTLNAVGRSLLLDGEETERRIVGVTGNTRDFDPAGNVEPELYLPYTQDPWLWMTAMVRSERSAESLAGELRKAVWRIDPDQPLTLSTMEDTIKNLMGDRRILGLSLTVFAALSLLLTCIGIYGVILYSVVRRTYEIGVRIAMGADSKSVLNLFLKETMYFVLIGTSLGVILALNLGEILQAFLWSVPATDITVYATVISTVLLSSMIACAIPIAKALKINPVEALRYE